MILDASKLTKLEGLVKGNSELVGQLLFLMLKRHPKASKVMDDFLELENAKNIHRVRSQATPSVQRTGVESSQAREPVAINNTTGISSTLG